MARNIAAELNAYSRRRSTHFSRKYKNLRSKKLFENFLNARLDQVRIYYALRISRDILRELGAHKAFIFQERVLRRERAGDIQYQKQRDHTCHTVNNFLLGWYLFENSPVLRHAFQRAFEERSFQHSGDRVFASIWIYVSLLHDIGYIFEGDYKEKRSVRKSKYIEEAVGCLSNHFNEYFWEDNGLEASDKELLLQHGLIYSFDVASTSRDKLAESLLDVSNLDGLLAAVEKYYPDHQFQDDIGKMKTPFDLWAENYFFFKNEKMGQAIRLLKKDFSKLQTQGLGKGGPVIFDHGVCSGLILFHFVTYYYLLDISLSSPMGGHGLSDIKRRYDLKEKGEMTIDLWWSGLVWATAATAIHNRYQALGTESGPAASDEVGMQTKLSLEDDPLAYLGIMVDELQFWDRFNVFDPVKDYNELPTQATQVRLGTSKPIGDIDFAAPNHEVIRLKKELDRRLIGWDRILNLESI